MRRRTYERSALDRDLRDAVSNGGLDVAFQPIVALGTGRVRGVEALARWNHPSRGAACPLEFVSVADESDLIAHVGRIVLERSCEYALLWGQLGRPIEIAVKVSARQLERGDLAPTVEETLTTFAVGADRVCLEITESMLVRANAVALTAIADMRAIGVRFAIDDFGVAYSSLAYLRDLPVDEPKIDRSFVADTARPGPDRELVAAIVAMGPALGLHVVAEGVEYEDQAATLRELRCHAAQGYLFSPGLHPDKITELLVSSATHPA